jgi:hypothetical protein
VLAQWRSALGSQHSFPVGPARWSPPISRSLGVPSCRAKAQAICKRNRVFGLLRLLRAQRSDI